MDLKPLTKLLFVDDDEDILTIAKYSLQKLKSVETKFVYREKRRFGKHCSLGPISSCSMS